MSLRLGLLALLCAMPASTLGAQEDVEALLRRLVSDKPEERETASKELIRQGGALRPRLERALQEGDAELTARVRRLLDDIDYNFDVARETFERLAVEEKASPQRLLWRGQKWLERAAGSRTWEQIVASLERQKLGVSTVTMDTSGRITSRWMVKPAAIATPQGQACDLLIEFKVTKAPEPGQRTIWTVEHASVFLRAEVRLPLRRALSEPRFPDDSAVQKALLDSLKDQVTDGYPDVENVEMTFRPLRDRTRPAERYASGFAVHLSFANRLEGKTDSGYRDVDVPSGLEPLRGPNGETLDAAHIPRDTTGAVVSQGTGSGTSIGLGLKRLDLPVPRDISLERPPETELVPQAWSVPDLEALPDGIRALRIMGSFLSEAGMKGLERFRKLETLEFRDGILDHARIASKVTDDDLRKLDALPKLRRLEIGQADLISDEGLRRIGALPHLVSLDIWYGPKITDRGLQALSSLIELEQFELMTTGPVSDAGIAALAKLPKLRRVRLTDLKGITKAGWSTLAKAPALREVELWGCSLNDEGLAEIGTAKDLELLYYLQSGPDESKITDAGLQGLAGLTNLRRLVLAYSKATPEGLRALQARLPGKYVSH